MHRVRAQGHLSRVVDVGGGDHTVRQWVYKLQCCTPDIESIRDHLVGLHKEARASVGAVDFGDECTVEADDDCH
jgi:hypothetical protein